MIKNVILKQFFIIILFIVYKFNYSQDIHLSQFFNSPTTLNPSNTGIFNGDFRFTGNYRSQWNSFLNKPFYTFIISADAKNFLWAKNSGIGINIYENVAGNGNLNLLKIEPSISYFIFLNKKKSKIISIGTQVSWNNRSINYSKLTFDKQFLNNKFTTSNDNGEVFSENNIYFFNTNFGVVYLQHLAKNKKFNVGLSISNIFKPNISFFKNQDFVYRRLLLHSYYKTHITKNISITPRLLFMQQGENNEIVIGSEIEYNLGTVNNVCAASFGMYSRIVDATFLYGKIALKKWAIGLSYDINYSKLRTNSSFKGAYEISISYIIKETLRKPNHRKICPSFI